MCRGMIMSTTCLILLVTTIVEGRIGASFRISYSIRDKHVVYWGMRGGAAQAAELLSFARAAIAAPRYPPRQAWIELVMRGVDFSSRSNRMYSAWGAVRTMMCTLNVTETRLMKRET